jgi:Zn-dependent protease
MKWSWKIGQFAGIGVYMHAIFLLLVGWVAVSHWVQARSLDAVNVVIAAALFAWLVVTDTFSPLAELSVARVRAIGATQAHRPRRYSP